MSVNLVFPARNRFEFTRQSWHALQANTNWSLVSEFHVYDDGSTDGTLEWLSAQPSWLTPKFHATNYRSPMGVTLDWIRRNLAQAAPAPLMAKLDNDTIYPPDWLDIAVQIMDRQTELDTLGLECMRAPSERLSYPHQPDIPPLYCQADGSPCRFNYLPARFVSGLGLYRTSIFQESMPEDRGYYGLEEWQEQRKLRAGWILPSLPVFLLDRMPMEPWRSLSERYIAKGWQRAWSRDLRYKEEQLKMWDWWEPQP